MQNGQKPTFPNITLACTNLGIEIRIWHTGYYFETIYIPPEQATSISKAWIQSQLDQKILISKALTNV